MAMRDDYISSRGDIRRKRYRKRRRQAILNRCLVIGLILIIILAAAIFIIKSCKKGEDTEILTNANITTSPKNDVTTASDNEETTEESTEFGVAGDRVVNDDERIVVIDPGHGGFDGGSVGNDNGLEKDDDLKMALALKKALETRGITVYMTREDDTFIELEDRAQFANDKNADLFLSVHRNKYGSDVSVCGYESWIMSTGPEKTTDIATRLQEALKKAGVSRDRGVKFGTQGSSEEDYVVNKYSLCPSVLLEMGFMDNAEDNSTFRNNTDKLADAMAQAIFEWFNAQGL